MTVVARGDEVLLVAPPGESAVLSVEQTQKLSRTLGQAAAANALSRTPLPQTPLPQTALPPTPQS